MVETAIIATMFVKVVIDIFRIGYPGELPTWVSPMLAVVLGQVFVVLITMSAGVPFVVADVVLAGILAAGSSVGVTDLSRRAN